MNFWKISYLSVFGGIFLYNNNFNLLWLAYLQFLQKYIIIFIIIIIIIIVVVVVVVVIFIIRDFYGGDGTGPTASLLSNSVINALNNST